MDERFLITGNSLMDLITDHGEIADEVIGLSVILEYGTYEFGTLLLKRASKSQNADDIHKIIEVGVELMNAISHMDKLTLNMAALEPMLNVGIYKKINFVQSSYIFTAREHNLILICNEKEIQDAAKEVGIPVLFTGNRDFEKKFTQFVENRVRI